MSYKKAGSRSSIKHKFKDSFLIKTSFEFTPKQSAIIDCMLDKKTKCVFISGPPGVGKTELSVFAGLHALQSGEQQKLLYIRTIVESASNKLGFLKGSETDKVNPYMQVFAEKLEGMLHPYEISNLTEEKKIISMPNNFIRGRTLSDSFVIADEFQNFTFLESKSLASRLGENSKLVFLYDPEQSDISSKYQYDADNFRNIFDNEESREQGIFCFSFDESDIKRSEFCKFIMRKLKNK